MKKKYTVAVMVTAFVTSSLLADPAADPAADPKSKVTVDMGADFVSNYVWRGDDMLKGYAEQRNKKYGSTSGAWAFQPTATVNLPVEGLYLNLWGSFAMEGREDKDSDHRLQMGQGGDNLLISNGYISRNGVDFSTVTSPWSLYNGVLDDADKAAGVDPSTLQGAQLLAFLNKYGRPGYYKEKNGTKRADETDYTIGYSTSSNYGDFDIGIVSYVLANSVGKANGVANEIFVGYALPFFTDLKFSVHSDMATANQYYMLAYEKSAEVAKNVEVFGGISSGYAVRDSLQGVQDVTYKLGFTAYGVKVSVNDSYRPDLKLHDPDTNDRHLPYYLAGLSTSGDGMVADPSKSSGLVNDLVNSEMSAALSGGYPGYKYTPMQKIPRHLAWVSVGYSSTFE
jgi:hypothetical protein